MKYEPHEYQKYAIGYIESHPIAAVLLSMGLGKTSISLTAINDLLFDSFEISKVLIVAPLRVASVTWSAEIEKWEHLKLLKYSVAVGTETERLTALNTQADIYIINRENVQWLIEKSGVPFNFDMVVIDELSSFKNHQAKRFKALMKARPTVKRVVGLTGTPSSNGLMDLFAEFKLLDMGARLGRFIGQYRAAYFRPDKMNGMVVYSYKPLPGAEEQIYEKISDITISMKATDHLKMPELISTNHTVYLSDSEQKKYDEMCQQLVLQMPDGEITAANAAALSGKLTQIANGAIYTDDQKVVRIHDRKLDALEDILESMNGRPLLVAYWYRHDYERIAGHGRVLAAKEEGITEVPCVLVDYLTEAQKKAYIIADNRFAMDAGWDEELLKIEIESLQGAEFDVSLTGFEPAELDMSSISAWDGKTRLAIENALQDSTKNIARGAKQKVAQRSGKLKKSIKTGFDRRKPEGLVKAKTPYAHIVEFGAKAHIVRAKNKKALSISAGGDLLLRKSAKIPARKGRPFIKPAFDAEEPKLISNMKKVLNK